MMDSKIGKALGYSMGDPKESPMGDLMDETESDSEDQDEPGPDSGMQEKSKSDSAEVMAMKLFDKAKSPEAKVDAMKAFLEACGATGSEY